MPIWFAGIKRPLQIGFTAAVLTAILTVFMPNSYMSEAKVLPADTKSTGLGGLAAAAAAFGVVVPGSDGADANFVDILQSRWMAEQLLDTPFTFRERAWRFGPEKEQTMLLSTYLKETSRDRAVKKVRETLVASRDRLSKIITISAETRSPSLSQAIVERTLGLLEGFVQQKGRTRGGAKATFADARLKEARQEMSQTEESLRQFLEGNRNYMTSMDPSIRLKGARLEAELKLRQQLVVTLSVNREQALLEEKNDIPILNILDPADLPVEKSKPRRSFYVLIVAFLSFTGALSWSKREWLKSRILEVGEGELEETV